MLKHRLHTAVILATAAVAPLSLEARFKSLFCHTTEDQRTATPQAPATDSINDTSAPKTPFKSKLMRLLGLNKTQRTKTISAQDNTVDSKEAKFLWTQPGSATHRLQNGHTPRENTASADTLSVAPPPANTQKKSVRFDTQTTSGSNTSFSGEETESSQHLSCLDTSKKSPESTGANQNPRWTVFLQSQIDDLPDITSTEACVDSIRFSQILEGLKPFLTSPQQPTLEGISEESETKPGINTQAAQPKAELANLSESSEETQQRTESPEEVSEEDPIKQQFNNVLVQLSQNFETRQQIAGNPQN